jgi:hypothetical protein
MANVAFFGAVVVAVLLILALSRYYSKKRLLRNGPKT